MLKLKFSRRRLLVAAGATGLIVAAVPVTGAIGLTGGSPAPDPHPTNSAPAGPKWSPQVNPQSRAADAGGWRGYVALAGGYNVSTVDVATHKILSTGIAGDAPQGVAATQDGKKVYVANTGQYSVLVADPVTHAERPITVGPYPGDVTLSPDGTKLYAAVTGNDTGKGGSDEVAVINTGTDTVARTLHVGTSPRQVAFDKAGRRAYVTYDGGIAVIDVAKGKVVKKIKDADGAQGVVVAGGDVYVTNPRSGKVLVINASTGRVRTTIPAGDQPWAIDVTPDGKKVYVTRMNANQVSVIDTAARKVLRTIDVGKLPGAVTVTPDGTEAWVGNNFSGSVSVIGTSTDTVTTTIAGGAGTAPINAAPLGIAFAKLPPT